MRQTGPKKWYAAGYKKGAQFARAEADYDELAAISGVKGIPANWDIFRAEILNTYRGDPSFDFQAYASGFTRACMEFFEKI
jgi:hypothetical protein